MKLADVMHWAPLYRAWQTPFANAKIAPVLKHNNLSRVRSVLDIGCGPGTNTHLFTCCAYLGIDCNATYIESARRRHKRDFVIADALQYEPVEQFDFILANSFFHHIATLDTRRLLAKLATLLAEGGCLHVIDLVLPPAAGCARTLARLDRGGYARPLDQWHELFAEIFEIMVFEPFTLAYAGVHLWELVYFKGRPR